MPSARLIEAVEAGGLDHMGDRLEAGSTLEAEKTVK